MHKMWLVARHEYLTNLKRKSFLVAAFGIPVFFVVIMALVMVVSSDQGNAASLGTVGYVDNAGILTQAIDKPDFFEAYADADTAKQALMDGTLGAYFVLPEQYIQSGVVEVYSLSNTPQALDETISNFVLANLAAGVESEIPVQRLENPVNMTVYLQDSGRKLTEEAIPSLFLTPMIFVMVFMMASQTTSGYLMSSVVEEKTNRIMEMLITSITPLQMLVGKIVGLGALGLTQLAVWAVVGVAVMTLGQDVPFLAGVSFPTDVVGVTIVYFLLSYALIATVMAGIGAIVGSEQESRQYAGLLSLIWVIPLILLITFIEDPNGTVPVILSMIPFTAPLSIILRMSFGAIPVDQVIISVVILLLTTVVFAWASAKIFRWGLLLYGKRATPRELWRVIRQSPQMGTVASQPTQEAQS
jgi:ABC-2 type transport system permease protein